MAPRRPATKRGPGRPTALTPKVQEQIKKLLSSGATVETAAVAAGVTRNTVQVWLRLGREAEAKLDAGESLTAREVELLEFLNSEQEARAHLKVRLMTALQKGAQEDWRAALAMLERLWPEEFAPKSRGVSARPAGGRPVGATSAPDREARPGVLYAVDGGKS